MKLTARLDRLEARRPRATPGDARVIDFDHEAYKAAFDAAVSERGIDAVMGEMEATFREALEVAP